MESRATDDQLSSSLKAWGVPLVSHGGLSGEPLPLPELLEALLTTSCGSRLRSCIVSLLLVHPREATAAIQTVLPRLAPEQRRLLTLYHTTAVCLQNKWRTRLGFAIGRQPVLEDLFAQSLGLPSPAIYHGLVTLAAIAEMVMAADSCLPRGLSTEAESLVRLLMEAREIELASPHRTETTT